MTEEKKAPAKNYKGFVAGVFSGVAKLSGQSKFPTVALPLLSRAWVAIEAGFGHTFSFQVEDIVLTAILQLVTHSTPSKSVFKLPRVLDSAGLFNVWSRPFAMRGQLPSIRARLLH